MRALSPVLALLNSFILILPDVVGVAAVTDASSSSSTQVVFSSLLLQGIDYGLLLSQPELALQFKEAMKIAFAEGQAFGPEDVEIELSSKDAHCIIVEGEIQALDGHITPLMLSLRDDRADLAQRAATNAQDIPGIAPLTMGPISAHICGESNLRALAALACSAPHAPLATAEPDGEVESMPAVAELAAAGIGRTAAVDSLRRPVPVRLFGSFPSVTEIGALQDARRAVGMPWAVALAAVAMLLVSLTIRTARRRFHVPAGEDSDREPSVFEALMQTGTAEE